MSEPIQSIAQNNYILQAPPPTATMFTTELEYDGDKISGYAGSAFKAGTDLEFGYDSADNISAINNSAISQTPSQKLYLQSPLTTGVSGTSAYIGLLSADLARMLGVDETVLWSGEGTSGDFTLSESPLNFNRIRVEYNSTNETINASTHDMGIGEFNFDPSKSTNIILETVFVYTPSSNNVITAINHGFAAYYNTQTTAWNRKMGGWTNKWAVGNPTTISSDRHFVFVNKVVGIGRKA